METHREQFDKEISPYDHARDPLEGRRMCGDDEQSGHLFSCLSPKCSLAVRLLSEYLHQTAEDPVDALDVVILQRLHREREHTRDISGWRCCESARRTWGHINPFERH